MNDRVYLLAVGILGLCAAICVGGMVYLSAHRIEVGPGLATCAGTCLGAIGGILTHGRRDHQADRPGPGPGPPGR